MHTHFQKLALFLLLLTAVACSNPNSANNPLPTVASIAAVVGTPTAAPLAETILPQGLVAYYPFDNDANDYSFLGNHAAVNGATLVPDRFGNPDSAYQFDGVDDYMEIPHSDTLSLSSASTLALWFYHQPQASAGLLHPVGKKRPRARGSLSLRSLAYQRQSRTVHATSRHQSAPKLC